MGKGDKQRPSQVSREEYEGNWDSTFGGDAKFECARREAQFRVDGEEGKECAHTTVVREDYGNVSRCVMCGELISEAALRNA